MRLSDVFDSRPDSYPGVLLGEARALDAIIGHSDCLRFHFLQFKMRAESKMVSEAWPTAQAVGRQWAGPGCRSKAHCL
jgi:hypothetical protein